MGAVPRVTGAHSDLDPMSQSSGGMDFYILLHHDFRSTSESKALQEQTVAHEVVALHMEFPGTCLSHQLLLQPRHHAASPLVGPVEAEEASETGIALHEAMGVLQLAAPATFPGGGRTWRSSRGNWYRGDYV